MRHASNFNPEWGYLAPAPSFARTARVVVVAGAVGATAGAAVVFSLVDRPAAEESVAARTLVQPVASTSTTVSTPAAARPQAEDQRQLPPQPQIDAKSAGRGQSAMLHLANIRAPTHAASESRTTSTTQHSACVAALAEAPAVADAPIARAAAELVIAPDGTLAQKKIAKKPRYTWRSAPRGEQGARGPLALLHPFGARAKNGNYLPRGEY
jgi:hypothetical protein